MKNGKKIIRIDLWKAVLIVVTAMLGSAGAGIYGSFTTINSDHFALATVIDDVTDLESSYVNIIKDLGTIKTDVGEIKGMLKGFTR